jgi:GntR family transcriptional regulator
VVLTWTDQVGYGREVPVSADDPRPPYVQVADDLREAIAAGRLTPGQRLPSGRELSAQYGVALMTVQKALSFLRDDGVLIAHRGRGTFVATDADARPAPSPEYTEISRQLGELRELLEQSAANLDTRLTALEKAAGVKPGRRSRPRRD